LTYWRGARDDRALGAPAHRAADVRQRRRAAAAGQDELGQPRQVRVVVGQPRIEPCHLRVLEHRVAGNAQLAAEVEQVVLDVGQIRAHVVGQLLRQQHADGRVQLVDIAHRRHAQAVLARSAAVAETGGAVVAGAGGDLREAVAHGSRSRLVAVTGGRDGRAEC